MEKVSIIIPIYNEENNIEKCVSNYLEQTYENKEILLIDNGSNDNSWNIILKLQNQYAQVKGFHMEEKGVSRARNYGIEKSEGKYLFFADADDYADDFMLVKMVSRLQCDNSQLVVAGYYFDIPIGNIENNYTAIQQNGMEMYLNNSAEIKSRMVDLWDSSLMYNVWNKLFMKDVIVKENLQFPLQKNFNEDRDFVRQYVLHVNKVSCMADCFYHYVRENQGSATSVYRENMLEIRKEEFKNLTEFFQEIGQYGKKEKEYIAREHLDRIIAYSESMFHSSELDKSKIKEEIKRVCEDTDTEYALKKAVPRSKKMKIMVIPYKLKRINLIYWMLKTIAVVRDRYPVMFHKLRQER